MDLSVVIVSWNTRELLSQCLKAIFASPLNCEFDVWVVDNASKDASAEMVRNQFPQVRLIENSENVGFARANNQAIQQSIGNYVLLVNSDAIVKPSALSNIVAFMASHNDAGIAGGKLIWPDGSFQSSFSDFPSLFSELVTSAGAAKYLFGSHFPSYALNVSQQVRVVDWVGGAFLIARRDAITQVGLLDEGFFMYGEEMDWCYRMRQRGWKVYYTPEAEIIHVGGQSSKLAGADSSMWLAQSHIRFMLKYRGELIGRVLAFFFRIASVVKATIWFAIGLVRNQRRAFAWGRARLHWHLAGANVLRIVSQRE